MFEYVLISKGGSGYYKDGGTVSPTYKNGPFFKGMLYFLKFLKVVPPCAPFYLLLCVSSNGVCCWSGHYLID